MFEILKDRAVIEVVGSDVQKFLQGMTTNDVINNQFSYNYLLNNQGRYLFDFFVFQKEAGFLIDVNKDQAQAFIKKVNFYKLRRDIKTIDISSEYSVVYSLSKINDSVYSHRDPRYNRMGYRSVVKNLNINKLEEKVDELYVSDKYKYSMPDGYFDLAYEKSIPIEYGGEELNAINYQKGCYIGQEVISRAKYQGVVRKKIYKMISGTDFASYSHGAEVIDNNNEVIGIFCSAYKNCAIALLRVEKYLRLEKKLARVGDNKVEIILAPWYN
jgi:tRNA-modifying protein YgfZ